MGQASFLPGIWLRQTHNLRQPVTITGALSPGPTTRVVVRRNFKAGLLCALSLGALVAALPASAQTASQADRLERLERDMQTLQRQVYRGGAGSNVITSPALGGGSGGGGDSAAASMPAEAATRFEVRLNQLEQQMQALTGQLEEMSFKTQQVGSRLDKAMAEVDFRLKELENKPGGAGAAAGAIGGAAATMPAAKGGAAADKDSGPVGSEGVGLAPGPGSLKPPGGKGAAPAATPDLKGASPQEQYDNAVSLLRQSDYDGAEKALKSFLGAHPQDPLAGNAQYWLGETYYVRGDHQQAAVAFLQGYQKYPKSSKAADSLLKLGLSMSALGKKQEACAALGRLNSEFADAPDVIKRRATGERQKLSCQ